MDKPRPGLCQDAVPMMLSTLDAPAVSAADSAGCSFAAVPRKPAARPIRPPFPVVKVLVVQSDDTSRLALSDLVAGFGYQVTMAATATQARGLLEIERPVAVLLDLALPDATTGLALARWLRNRFGPTIVVIVVTCGLTIAELEAAERAWADFVLTKPVDLDQLNAILLPVRTHVDDGERVDA